MTPPNDHSHAFQSPRGTRDFYPLELAKRRWIEDKWRKTAVRHGFDEIDGPTFEHLDLYTVKSGDGIVSELFSFTRQGGETRFALRPEFTPTLARMAAAKANALPKPTKWFSIGPYFRAERPQRGRLREFLQWNVDVIGDVPLNESREGRVSLDADVIECCVDFFRSLGLSHDQIKLSVSSREIIDNLLNVVRVPEEHRLATLALLDRRSKLDNNDFKRMCHELDFDPEKYDQTASDWQSAVARDLHIDRDFPEQQGVALRYAPGSQLPVTDLDEGSLAQLWIELKSRDLVDWCQIDLSIVRGLAYYTGTVFEVHETTGAERAIAGGGRYDNLIELFGGPPTPAVGFAMGDVVLSLVLQDKGLMPSDEQIASDLGLRPDVFVIPTAETEHLVKPLVARLRREGMHARHTYKSTRNVGKLLKEAGNAHARFALILESDSTCSIKNLDANEQEDNIPIEEAVARIAPPERS